MNGSCKSCRFWTKIDGLSSGFCRRMPPAIISEVLSDTKRLRSGGYDYLYGEALETATRFPITPPDEWCGEWRGEWWSGGDR